MKYYKVIIISQGCCTQMGNVVTTKIMNSSDDSCHHSAKTSLEVHLPSQCLSVTICQVKKSLPILQANCHSEKRPGPNLFRRALTELSSPWWLRWRTGCPQRSRPRFGPWIGGIPQRKAWQPTAVFLPAGSHGHFTFYYTVKTADFLCKY